MTDIKQILTDAFPSHQVAALLALAQHLRAELRPGLDVQRGPIERTLSDQNGSGHDPSADDPPWQTGPIPEPTQGKALEFEPGVGYRFYPSLFDGTFFFPSPAHDPSLKMWTDGWSLVSSNGDVCKKRWRVVDDAGDGSAKGSLGANGARPRTNERRNGSNPGPGYEPPPNPSRKPEAIALFRQLMSSLEQSDQAAGDGDYRAACARLSECVAMLGKWVFEGAIGTKGATIHVSGPVFSSAAPDHEEALREMEAERADGNGANVRHGGLGTFEHGDANGAGVKEDVDSGPSWQSCQIPPPHKGETLEVLSCDGSTVLRFKSDPDSGCQGRWLSPYAIIFPRDGMIKTWRVLKPSGGKTEEGNEAASDVKPEPQLAETIVWNRTSQELPEFPEMSDSDAAHVLCSNGHGFVCICSYTKDLLAAFKEGGWPFWAYMLSGPNMLNERKVKP